MAQLDDSNNVFFTFKVADLGKAKAFIDAPEAAKTGTAASVIDADYWFLEDAHDTYAAA